MNPVVHFEIPFDDEERTLKFYKEVFDWQIQSFPEMKYNIAHTTEVDEKQMPLKVGAINGGLYKRDANSAKSPVLVINVQNIDAHLEKIKASDGKIVRGKMQVGDMGFYAQVQDTEGNVIGLWENVKKTII